MPTSKLLLLARIDFSAIQSVAQLLCRLRYPGFFFLLSVRYFVQGVLRSTYIPTNFLRYYPICISSVVSIFVFVVFVVVVVVNPLANPSKVCTRCCLLFFPWRNSPSGPRPPYCRGFMITLRHTTVGRTPLDEWSARRRDHYLTTHSTHKRQTSMSPTAFEPTIPTSERQQIHALDRAATANGWAS
jgi:hypothetical protein